MDSEACGGVTSADKTCSQAPGGRRPANGPAVDSLQVRIDIDHIEANIRVAGLNPNGRRDLWLVVSLGRWPVVNQEPRGAVNHSLPGEAILVQELLVLQRQYELTARGHRLALRLIAGQSLELLDALLAQIDMFVQADFLRRRARRLHAQGNVFAPLLLP